MLSFAWSCSLSSFASPIGVEGKLAVKGLGGKCMNHPPIRPGMIDAPHRRGAVDDLHLEGGERIRDFELSYVTHGQLNDQRDNTVLVTVSLAGNHHRLDFLIGPGQALDPERYFIVCVDAIGNGLTTSPSNSVAQSGMRFPRFCDPRHGELPVPSWSRRRCISTCWPAWSAHRWAVCRRCNGR